METLIPERLIQALSRLVNSRPVDEHHAFNLTQVQPHDDEAARLTPYLAQVQAVLDAIEAVRERSPALAKLPLFVLSRTVLACPSPGLRSLSC